MENCANPLLAKFLKEWLDEARARNTKGVTTYKRAYDSMVACPMKFDHPLEAQQLKGLGEKLCQRLYEEYKLHCEREGLPMPTYRPPRKRRRTGNNLPDELEDEPRPVSAKKVRKSNLYVPGYRTGPYAIMRALSTLDEESNTGLTKAQLVELAQQWSESSFTAPSEPGKFWTAWDSHKTLVEKKLIHICSHKPAKRYALLPEGWDVVKTINRTENAAANGTLEHLAPSINSQVYKSGEQIHDANSGNERNALIRPTPTGLNEGQRINRNVAEMSTEELQAELQRREEEKHRTPAAQPSRTVHRPCLTVEAEALLSKPSKPPSLRRPLNEMTEAPRSTIDLEEFGLGPSPNQASLSSRSPPEPSSNLPTFTPLVIPPGDYTIRLIIDHREKRSKIDKTYIEEELRAQGIAPIVRSLELGDALWVAKTKNPMQLRELGEDAPDTTSATSPQDHDLATHDEIVLDHIVERKRLDDLISSVKDGRFQEQKFRLKRCGIPNVIYLVEEISLSKDEPLQTMAMIDSAMATTQIVNGFFVKRTHKLDETIRYLARMTKMLQKLYENEPLYVIPSRVLASETYQPLLKHLKDTDSARKYNITFPAFTSLASKSDTLTLRDVFLKMLMCTRGVTGDRAMEMQKWWKTPREFVEAYEEVGRSAGKQAAQEMVFGVMGGMAGNRKMGKTLSAKVGEVWGNC